VATFISIRIELVQMLPLNSEKDEVCNKERFNQCKEEKDYNVEITRRDICR